MRFLRQVMVITTKDLRAEVRTKEAVNGSHCFRDRNPTHPEYRLRA